MTIVSSLINCCLLTFLSPMFVGIIRKVKAFMQNRQGASILQPYADLWKLFHKDEIIPTDSSWIFRSVPYILFGISIFLFSSVTLSPLLTNVPYFSDFIVVVGFLALSAFLLSLAGMDTGSAFGGFGSSREMTLSALTEGTLVFSFLPVAFIAHTTSILTVAVTLSYSSWSTLVPVLVAFLGFFIALMCETGRIPFDNAATHLELTMIHEAMILEYSGKRLAFIEWASANKFLFFLLLGVTVFFPWTPHINMIGWNILFDVSFTLLKVVCLVVVIGIIESSIAKFRFFRLPDILMTGFICGIIALLILGV